MKDLFDSFGIVVFFKILFKYIKVLNMVIVPFYVFYGFLWGVLIIASFLMCKLPLHIPLPFVGETMVDRFLLLGGLILGIGYYLETFKKK
jgi:high-affinity Fe2+/Pb2+ permease